MDLRSGHPYWLIKNGILSKYPSLKDDAVCDAIVLGAGVSGAFVAQALARAGVNVIVLDRRDVGTGSTAASTALLQHATDTELVELAEHVGEDVAVRTYRLGIEAIDRIERLIEECGDDCAFVRRPTLYKASVKRDVARLQLEWQLRRNHGFDVEYLDASAIADRFPFDAPAGLLSRRDAEVDVVRLTHAVLRQAHIDGARIYDRNEATHIQCMGDRVIVTVDNRFKVSARRIIFATGYVSAQYLKHKVGTLQSTFALITEPIEAFPRWPERCLIWETARPYTYFRSTQNDRILMGGGDVPFATAHKEEGLIKTKAKSLERQFRRTFPDCVFEQAFAWAGTFGTTKDGLPYIGQVPEWPCAYFALGFGGNGITMSKVAADIIADFYLGRASADAAMFRFDR